MDDRIRKAILTRKPVPSYYLNVAKFLDMYGVSGYENICMNRIWNRMIDYVDMIKLELKCRNRLYLAYIGIKNKLSAIWFQYQNKHKLRAFITVMSRYE